MMGKEYVVQLKEIKMTLKISKQKIDTLCFASFKIIQFSY